MSFWKKVLRTNFTDVRELAAYLNIPTEKLFIHSKFVLNLPRRLADKIEKGRMEDPLLRQFVPLQEETIPHLEFLPDPVGDVTFKKSDKLIQKYHGRALVVSTSACAMHCRYCFRQNFPYETQRKGFEKEIRELQENTSITEAILSGGDPLSLSDEVLGNFLKELDKIPHLTKIRFHTRFPIGIPERIDDSFIALLSEVQKQMLFVIHVNHPKELDEDVLKALKSVAKLGIPLLCQSVLLKGVNDNLEILKALFEKLIDHGIIPYYLHQLDKVQGASHFEVPREKGLHLIQELLAHLPGYAIPRYVEEIPGALSKKNILHPIDEG